MPEGVGYKKDSGEKSTRQQGSKEIDFWESKQGDGSAGTYRKKLVPGGRGSEKGTYTPERD